MTLPDAMTTLPHWVVYRIEKDDEGKPTKIPYRADGKGKASTTNPDTWSDFTTALHGVETHGFDGPGFVFTKGGGIVGIDLDHCIDSETGAVAEWAQTIVDRLDSYTELSPSGTGLHIFCYGVLPGSGKKKNNLEMYDSARYFTVTARHYAGTPETVCVRPDAVAALYAEWFLPTPTEPPQTPSLRTPTHFLPNDSELLNKARNAKNGSQFAALFDNGDTSAYGGDDSRADLALASSLLFWSGGDCDRAERLFTQSALGQREKWQRPDYRQRTFSKAQEGMTEFYTPSDRVDLQQNRKNYTQNSEKTDQNGNSVNSVEGFSGNSNLQPARWEPVAPLDKPNLPPFPTDALPPVLRHFVEALAAATETPPDLAALLVLPACASCVAQTARVALSSDWTEPLNLFTLTVLPPASRKSAVYARVMSPLVEYERTENQRRGPEITQAKLRHDMMTGRLKELMRQATTLKDALQREEAESEAEKLNAEIQAFPMPSLLRLTCDDVTPEKLACLLSEQNERIGVFSAEGDIFDILGGRYSEGKPNIGLFLKAHSGDSYQYDRKSGIPLSLYSPALTVGLTAQPDVLRGLTDHKGFRGRGLLGRLLYALPQDTVGRRHNQDIAVPAMVEQGYHNLIYGLLGRALDALKEEDRQIPLLRLNKDARQRFQQFRNEVEPMLREGETLGELQDWGGKLCGQVARIAAVLHLVEQGGLESLISLPTVEAAIRIGEYLIEHARAAFGEMRTDDAQDKARAVVQWIKQKELLTFTRRDVQRNHPSRFPHVEDADPVLSLLEQHGYLRKLPVPKREGAGQSPSPIYESNPCILFDRIDRITDLEGPGTNSVNSVKRFSGERAFIRGELDAVNYALALSVGRRRKKDHDDKRKAGEDLGSDAQNEEVDRNGALAELAALQDAAREGVPVSDWLPLEDCAVPRPDALCWNAVPVEVKAISPGSNFFYVRENQRLRFKDIDNLFYLPVLLENDGRRYTVCEPISAAEVSTWKLMTPADNPKIHETCRSLPVKELCVLTDWNRARLLCEGNAGQTSAGMSEGEAGTA